MVERWTDLGLWIVFLTVLFFGGTIVSVIRYLFRWRKGYVDVSNGLFLLALLFGQPILVYENLLFVHLEVMRLPISFSVTVLKVFLVLSSFGIILYNLQFLVLEDFPFSGLLVLAALMGIGIGGMVAGVQFDPLTTPPLYYSPVIAGVLYVGSLGLFNLVGLVGLFLSKSKGARLSFPYLFSAVLFFSGSIAVFFTRVVLLLERPSNLLILPFLVPSFILLILYRYHGCGYSVRAVIIGLAVLDTERNVVLAGYHPEGSHTQLTLDGMAFLAAQTALVETLGRNEPFRTRNLVHLFHGSLMVLLVLSEGGEKIGRYCARRLLMSLATTGQELDDPGFADLLHRSFFPFFGCNGPDPDTVFVHHSI